MIFLFARLQRQRAQLRAQRELARLAAVDPLTGLRNRRAIEQYLHDALSAARRHDLACRCSSSTSTTSRPSTTALATSSGDAVLAHAARVLDGALRAEDAIGRWGGEEFLVVLPGTDEEGALHVTERLRAALAADQPEEARAHGLPVTITIGVAEWRDEESIGELISRADWRCIWGRTAGRDTAHVCRDRPAVRLKPAGWAEIPPASFANLLITRERRWSDCLKVLAGPWRCPAAKSGG